MNNLFRPQVIHERSSRLHGEVILFPKFSHTVIVISILVWATMFLLWAFSAEYTKKENVTGWLEFNEGVSRLYENDGFVESILVKDEDKVEKGEPLVVINNEKMLLDGRRLGVSMKIEYEKINESIKRQLNQIKAMYLYNEAMLERKYESTKKVIKILNSQYESARERHLLSENQLKNMSNLVNLGHISKLDYESKKQQVLVLLADTRNFSRELIIQNEILDEIKNGKELREAEYKNKLEVLSREINENSLQSSQLDAQQKVVLYAEKNGTVSSLQMKVGDRVERGKPILSIIPDDVELKVHLLVPVKAVAFIEVGQKINIRYDAFAYEKFGIYEAIIEKISQTILLPGDILNTSLRVEVPVYSVIATLTKKSVIAYGKEYPLKDGMTLEASIRVDEGRTLIEWLFEPIYSLKGRL